MRNKTKRKIGFCLLLIFSVMSVKLLTLSAGSIVIGWKMAGYSNDVAAVYEITTPGEIRDRYLKEIQQEREALYNSEDSFTAYFSQAPALQKMLVAGGLLILTAGQLFGLFMVICFVISNRRGYYKDLRNLRLKKAHR